SAPNITSDGLPTSLSYEMITGKLRDELGYDGVVITDSLYMGAIRNHYKTADVAVLAIQAGADILLTPTDFVESYEAIINAVESGEITEARIDESVFRILMLKYKYCGLILE
ncbi:MAG: glycoside hydrolase family 3 N-terminal domain-containing protein, partial [Wujia sp.]